MVYTQADDQNYDEDDIEQDHNERDADENYNDSIEISNGLKVEHNGHLATKKNGIHGSSFTGALHILCNEVYHLKDAFPELCKEYGIISAIPISSCTAERMQLFCAKACENTIEVYDGAEEAGRLLLLSAERKTLTKKIDSFARSSSHLLSALL